MFQGSWTPLHADVLRSFSWSVNVAGAKRWLLLPPQHTHLLYDRFGRCMAPSFSLGPRSGACHLATARLWCVNSAALRNDQLAILTAAWAAPMFGDLPHATHRSA